MSSVPWRLCRKDTDVDLCGPFSTCIVYPDNVPELDETFTVRLEPPAQDDAEWAVDAANAAVEVTIKHNDASCGTFNVSSPGKKELAEHGADSKATFTVRRDTGIVGGVKVPVTITITPNVAPADPPSEYDGALFEHAKVLSLAIPSVRRAVHPTSHETRSGALFVNGSTDLLYNSLICKILFADLRIGES